MASEWIGWGGVRASFPPPLWLGNPHVGVGLCVFVGFSGETEINFSKFIRFEGGGSKIS